MVGIVKLSSNYTAPILSQGRGLKGFLTSWFFLVYKRPKEEKNRICGVSPWIIHLTAKVTNFFLGFSVPEAAIITSEKKKIT